MSSAHGLAVEEIDLEVDYYELSEAIMEAAAVALGEAIHVINR